MRALLWLVLGLAAFLGVALMLLPSGAEVVALPAAIVAVVIVLVLLALNVLRRRREDDV